MSGLKSYFRFVVLCGLVTCSAVPAVAQEVFHLDFEEALLPAGWQASEEAEWGHRLGVDGSSYFRFHPYTWRDEFGSPLLELADGVYTLHFMWSEAATGNPDMCRIAFQRDGGVWEEVYEFGGGNGRIWQVDSVVLGSLAPGSYRLRFEYQSQPRYPSQYINLDEVRLVRSESAVTASPPGWTRLIRVGPVPAGERLFWSIPAPVEAFAEVCLISSTGIKVYAASGASSGAIPTGGLPPGLYFFELRGTDGIYRRPVIIAGRL